MDSFWLPDHLNALLPRSIATPKYVGAARLAPKADAFLEPWTVLGHLAARNRLGRLRLGIGVTDAGRRNPAVTAQAAATLHLLTRGRAILGIGTGEREGNEPYGVDWSRPVARFEEAIATIRALWVSGGQLVTRDSPLFSVAQRRVRPATVPRKVAGNLDRVPRAEDAARHRTVRRRMVSRANDQAEGLRSRAGGSPGRRRRCRTRSHVYHPRDMAVGGYRRQPRRG